MTNPRVGTFLLSKRFSSLFEIAAAPGSRVKSHPLGIFNNTSPPFSLSSRKEQFYIYSSTDGVKFIVVPVRFARFSGFLSRPAFVERLRRGFPWKRSERISFFIEFTVWSLSLLRYIKFTEKLETSFTSSSTFFFFLPRLLSARFSPVFIILGRREARACLPPRG